MLTGASGNDSLVGGAGLDRVSWSEDTDFTLTDSMLTGAGTDALSTIEAATLTGGSGSNVLDASGFTGAATLSGADGNDSLLGGSGADTLNGGAGLDSFNAGGAADSIQARDAVAESQILCGTGADSVFADASDVAAADCEQVLLPLTLTVTRAGTGTGGVSSSPAGIDCGADCSEIYDSGTVVTLTAAASAGSTFAGWSGACSGSGACVVTMAPPRT